MFLTIQDLKVDQTIIPSENNCIFVTNINIPESEFEHLAQVLEHVHHLFVIDYVNVSNIQYQVCATYDLRNSQMGDSRQWKGSFNPKGNQANTLSPFKTFNAANFATLVQEASSPENIYAKLRFYHVQTNWVFHRLTSIIIAVQSVVNVTHPTLLQRNLLMQRRGYGGRKRNVQSFLLP